MQVVRVVQCVYNGSKMVQFAFTEIVVFELDETGCKFFEKSSLQMFLDPSGVVLERCVQVFGCVLCVSLSQAGWLKMCWICCRLNDIFGCVALLVLCLVALIVQVAFGFSSQSVELSEVVSSCSKLCQLGLSCFLLFRFLLLFILSQVVLGSFNLYVLVHCC